MSRQRGVALAASLVLLLVLCVLALSGARLGAAELRQALAGEMRVARFEAAQSLIDGFLAGGGAGNGLSVRDVEGPALPPLVGTGYSADRFTTLAQRLVASPEPGVRVEEILVRLQAAPVVAAPKLGPDCAPAQSATRRGPVLVDGAVETLELAASGSAFVARHTDGSVAWTGTHPQWRDAAVAGVALLDADADGAVDRLVVGDSGGALWRADLAGPVSSWKVSLLARTAARITAATDLVQSRDAHGRYDAVIVAGEDALMLVRDRHVEPGAGADAEGDFEGWRAPMPGGQRLRAAPLTVAGTIYFLSWAAGAAATCEDGADQAYAADLASGAPRPLGPAFAGPPMTLDYAGPAAGGGRCGVRLAAGATFYDVPGCTRFRSAWTRAGA